MWGWFTNYSIWILIIAGLVVFLLLLFSDKIRNFIAKVEPEKWQQRAVGSITTIFWTIEGIAVVVMVLAFVAITMSGEGARAMITPETIQSWFLEYGVEIIVILVVAVILWAVLKRAIPPLVRRIMARPQKGESREGLKRRADTLQGVFLGLVRIVIILLVVLMILSEFVSIGPLLAGLGVVGIAVGFGAQYLIRDLIAGIFILLETWLVPFEGAIVDRIGPRWMVLAGGIATFLAWYVNSIASSLGMLYLGGAIAGFAGGAVYGTCVGNALKWFPDKRGLCGGLTAAGFGAGAAVTIAPIRSMIERKRSYVGRQPSSAMSPVTTTALSGPGAFASATASVTAKVAAVLTP